MLSIMKKKAITRLTVVLSVLIVAKIAIQHIMNTLTIEMEKARSFMHTQVTACHYSDDKMNVLPNAEDVFPPPDSIFFHETSCKIGLNSRQACSIESAARLHPHRHVYVYFNSPISEADLKTGCLSTLLRYANIKLVRLHIDEYAKKTPMEDFITSKKNTLSDYPVVRTADMLRFVTLYKYGGVYLDTDILLVKPLDALGKNWAARQDPITVNTAAMAFSLDDVEHYLTASVMKYIIDNFQNGDWSYNDGSRALTLSLLEICNTTNVLCMSAAICQGFEVYDSKMFYPLHDNITTYFLTGTTNLTNAFAPDRASFGYHLWNQVSSTVGVKIGSPYEVLARKHCPLIREQFGVNFGADIERWQADPQYHPTHDE